MKLIDKMTDQLHWQQTLGLLLSEPHKFWWKVYGKEEIWEFIKLWEEKGWTPYPKNYRKIKDIFGIEEEEKEEELEDILLARKYILKYEGSKDRGLEFSLTLSQFKALLKRKTCYYIWVKFEDWGNKRLSIDRIDSNKGYVDGNVVACCSFINNIKNILFESECSNLRISKKHLLSLLNKLPDYE